jgi:hypothetical protein
MGVSIADFRLVSDRRNTTALKPRAYRYIEKPRKPTL